MPSVPPPPLHASRRGFIAGTSALAAAAISPRLLARAAGQDDRAQDSPDHSRPTQDALILVNLRGGADGLSLCIPHAEPRYYTERPNIAIPRPGSGPSAAIDLDGFFGLAPALAPILPAFRAGHLAIVHAVGAPTRHSSHFRAQRALDSGVSSDQPSTTSWITRWAQAASAGAPARAVSIGGPRPIDAAPFLSPALIEPEAQPGASPLLSALNQAVSVLGADAATRIVSIDCPGWDTHAHQDAPSGALESSMTELAAALAEFHRAAILKQQLPITLVCCTEFGRTTAENALRGTDHGHGSACFILGSRVRGGRVIANWPGLGGPDLSATIDIHDILAEVLSKGLRDSATTAETALPGRAAKFPGVMLT